ncbi:MAG: CoA transferase [Pseudomonadota bacterium]
MTVTALNGIRVLDLSAGPAGGLATMVMADFGAEVLLLDQPDHPLNKLAAAPMWRRGKALLELDIHAQRDTFHELCAGADVLVCNWRPGALARHHLTYPEIANRHPHLIMCHITGFGPEGPWADIAGYEHVAAALSGRMRLFTGLTDRDGPVFSALQVGVHACAQSALSGVLAALYERGRTNQGRLVETSILRGLMAYEQGTALAEQFREAHPELPVVLPATEKPPLPSLFYHPAQAGDGRWMQFGNLLPHLFDNFLIATDLIDVVSDPDFNPAQLMLPPEKHEAFRNRMLKRIQDQPANTWMEHFVADGGIVAAPYQTTQEAMLDPDIVSNGHVVELEGVRQLGPLAKLSATPATPAANAEVSESMVTRWITDPRQLDPKEISHQAPLTGVKVVEIATIIAAPLAASFLADMGAEVIKVEQVGGDPYRGMGGGIGSTRVNAGKRSISVNLKSEAGNQAVLQILHDADILIHNFRPGVPEKLGIGYDAVKAVNPNIIYLQSNGYGPDGPGANRPSTHPIPGAAIGGVMYQMAESLPTQLLDFDALKLWTSRVMRANEVNPDPNTALVITSSVLLALVARETNGQGQQVWVDMFGANAYANHDDFLAYEGKPGRLLPDKELQGLSTNYSLYPCADDGWIFVAAVTAAETQALNRLLTEHHTDSLKSFCATRTQADCLDILGNFRVPCAQADGDLPATFWLEHPQVAANQMFSPATHKLWGDYQRHGAMVTFSNNPNTLRGAPLAGEHNTEILDQAGLSDAEVALLTEAGVLYSED